LAGLRRSWRRREYLRFLVSSVPMRLLNVMQAGKSTKKSMEYVAMSTRMV
jgi:hypothetical protein